MGRALKRQGKLIVFEGPDGVGKSTISRAVAATLEKLGEPCVLMSFPGREEGTLGGHVYALHHDLPGHGITQGVSPVAMQALHVAAHADVVARRILPELAGGRHVVLDRFWWSTWVYGMVGGADTSALGKLIEFERAVWGGVTPAAAFLIRRDSPVDRSEDLERWGRLDREYVRLAGREGDAHPVLTLQNAGSLDDAVESVLKFLRRQKVVKARRSRGPGSDRGGSESGLFDPARPSAESKGPFSVHSSLTRVTPTVVYDTYWRFAAERQKIFFKRFEGAKGALTDDPVLAKYKFTNAYRASDRTSQYLIRRVIYRDDLPDGAEEVFFRIILFKLFNKIETWELLEKSLGPVTYEGYSFRRYDRVLSEAMRSGRAIYSAAYIMPSGGKALGHDVKHRNHLKLIERMMADRLAAKLSGARRMKEGFDLLQSYPTMGDFLAYQFITDVNYSTVTDFGEEEFVMPGPGALDGIRKCFSDLGGMKEADVIRAVAERQAEEFKSRALEFRSLWGRPLQLIDCQNLFCEVDKYARIAHPEFTGVSGRTRIKQKFTSQGRAVECWYPPKWGINDLIEKAKKNLESRGGHGASHGS